MKKVFKLIVLTTLALVMVGCSGSKSSSKIIVYSNAVSSGRGEWISEKAKEAGFDVELVDIGGSALVDRLVSEKNNPVADVIIGSNQIGLEKLKAADVLEKFEPAWASETPDGYNDKDGYYYPYDQTAILMIYNQDKFTDSTAPKGWSDLVENPAYADQYFVDLKLTGGTIQVLIATILSDYLDPSGDLGVSAEGWNVIQGYFSNGYLSKDGDNFQGLLATGDVPITRMWSSGMKTMEEEFSQQFGIVKPVSGVPFVVEQIGLVSGSKNSKAALEFIDWVGSVEVRKAFALEFGSLPVLEAARDTEDVRTNEILKDLTQKDLDWEFITKNIDAWVEKIELELRD